VHEHRHVQRKELLGRAECEHVVGADPHPDGAAGSASVDRRPSDIDY
jgi:hypothetical protein